MQKEIFFKAISVKERQPEQMSSIHVVLLDGRLPMMAQYNPQGWCYLSGIPAKGEPQLIGGKGVSHWLEKQKDETVDYPPIVKMTLAFLVLNNTNTEWFAIDRTGYAYEHSHRPVLHQERHIWTSNGDSLRDPSFPAFRQDEYFNLLFQRTLDGWVWVGKPE